MRRSLWTLAVATVVVTTLIRAAGGAGADQAAAGAPLPATFSGPVTAMASPAPDGAMFPNLAAGRMGRVWMSWLETRAGGGHRFRLASLAGATWSPAVTVAEGADFVANWADFPSVFVAADGTLAAHWLARGATRSAYGVRLRTSRDHGTTWTAIATPHHDDTPTEHGFVSFYDAPGGGLGLAWLDGREMAGHDGASHGGGNMTLRAAPVKNGVPGEEVQIDARVCDCCQTSAARAASGVVLAYRDRSPEEIRDISVVRLNDKGRWSAPVTVGADRWAINGCPVNGPAIDARGEAVGVAWFTAAGGTPKTQIAFSTDGGASFSTPVRMNAAETFGRLHLAMLDADRALVSSLERGANGAQIVVREAHRDGRLGAPVVLGPATIDRSGGFARMAIAKGRAIVAWTEVRAGAAPRLRVVAAPLR